ncbi:hypothetical protein BOX15_Mlig028565g1 [Macrostomum lignano]|uniref:long-chain-fatty-acid--CoA ligase n=1 Tax=Macrostomum lignano TaxID=282301 RepID=A0A267GWL4_9PLAT|nr:hypothetical protein BOX15_Mlig028565g1 [Macrostomum lignano]
MQNFLIWSMDAVSGLYSLVTLPLYYAANLTFWPNSTTVSSSKQQAVVATVKVDYPGTDEDGSCPAVWASSAVAQAAAETGKSVPDCLASRPFAGVENLADLLDQAAGKYPERRCFGTRQLLAETDELQPDGRKFKKQSLGPYSWLSYRSVHRRVIQLAKSLRSQRQQQLGLRPGVRVALYAETRADWQLCAQACFRCGLPVVTLYASLGEDALAYGVNQSEAAVLVTSLSLLDKVTKMLDQMPNIRCVIYLDGGVGDESALVSGRPAESRQSVRLVGLSQLIGEDVDDATEDDTAAAAVSEPGDLAVLMYTSGSTGQPKGVMISHANLLAMAAGVARRIPELGSRADDSYLAYLPLAHVLELAAELACLACGVAIGYGSPLTLTDASNKVKPGTPGDATALRPSLMAAVPAVLDRASRAVRDRAEARGAIGRALLTWALDYKLRWGLRGWATPLLDRLVFKKVSVILGGRLRLMLSGGAPLSAETHTFAMSAFGSPVVQGFGLTETCGAGCIQASPGPGHQPLAATPLGSAGPPLDSCLLRLRDWPEGGYSKADKPWPRGELLIGGPCVTAGYFQMPELTGQDFWTDGCGVRWFCTGDVGQVAGTAGLQIVDRKKDLVKLQGGEYVSLGKVELALSSSPIVEQLCAYADSRRDFVVLLVVPKRRRLMQLAQQLGLRPVPTDATGGGQSHANGDGLQPDEALLSDPRLRKAALDELTAAAKGRLERFETPAQVHLCAETAWLPESGLVTDSFKLRRRQLLDRYRKAIEDMYGREDC